MICYKRESGLPEVKRGMIIPYYTKAHNGTSNESTTETNHQIIFNKKTAGLWMEQYHLVLYGLGILKNS